MREASSIPTTSSAGECSTHAAVGCRRSVRRVLEEIKCLTDEIND